MTTEVTTEADIRDAHTDIGGRAVEAIRALLDGHGTTGNEAVVWLKDWIAKEKNLTYTEGHPQIAVGVVDRQTEKAWQIGQAWTPAEPVWVPKSQARVFVLADGVSEVESAQRTLGDV